MKVDLEKESISIYSFLSVGFGVIADIDIGSEL
jgi:hypothetical protein